MFVVVCVGVRVYVFDCSFSFVSFVCVRCVFGSLLVCACV